MDLDLSKLEALTTLLDAEVRGEEFDRDTARHLASDLRRDFPAIRESMNLVLMRLSGARH